MIARWFPHCFVVYFVDEGRGKAGLMGPAVCIEVNYEAGRLKKNLKKINLDPSLTKLSITSVNKCDIKL